MSFVTVTVIKRLPTRTGLQGSRRSTSPTSKPLREELVRRRLAGQETILVSLRSFTPTMRGGDADRPWQIGVLHHLCDASFALGLLGILRNECDLRVGANEP